MPTPPTAPKRPTVLSFHGDDRVDDWAWLRDDAKADPDVLAHLAAENTYVAEGLATTDVLQAELFDEIKARVLETDLSVPYRKRGWWYATRTEEGQQYPIWSRSSVGPEGPWEVLFDGNAEAGESPYFSVGALDVSPSAGRLLFSTDFDGNELHTMRVRDLATGADLAETIEGTYYGTAWLDDDTFLYTVCDAAMRPFQVWRHVVGTDPAEDVCIFDEPDERFFVGVDRSRSERVAFVDCSSKISSECWYLPTAEPLGALRCVHPREEGLEYTVEDAGDRLLITTNADGAVDFALFEAPIDEPGRARWTVLRPHQPGVKLEGVEAFAGHLVVYERSEALRRARIIDRATGADRLLDLPEPVYAVGGAANPEFDTGLLRFSYTSPVTPLTVYEEDVVTGERRLLKQQPVLGGYDPAEFECGRLWATADDGARVPVTYVHKRGVPLDGSNPCLLYGYGSYEACIDPGFSSLRLSLLERGVVFAIAHVRGGGELGRPWYDDGKMLRKANTFTDFIACAEHLFECGYTTSERLAIRGASAGGLLIGAVLNLRPDLCRAAVAEVPFVDCLSTILDPTLPLTVTEWEEWGNPLADPLVYACMRSYSPYDNV
ncbi:MAG: S9 family peptidase, partial [Acidimicrobiia bacterium]|nr:S9 family peptidase [Acidimicrobiia bacterium]